MVIRLIIADAEQPIAKEACGSLTGHSRQTRMTFCGRKRFDRQSRRHSNLCRATVDEQFTPCNKAAVVRSQEQGGGRYLRRVSEPAQRRRCFHGVLHRRVFALGFRQRMPSRRRGGARRQNVDADFTRSEVQDPIPRKAADCSLTGGINAERPESRCWRPSSRSG